MGQLVAEDYQATCDAVAAVTNEAEAEHAEVRAVAQKLRIAQSEHESEAAIIAASVHSMNLELRATSEELASAQKQADSYRAAVLAAAAAKADLELAREAAGHYESHHAKTALRLLFQRQR